MLLFFYRTPAHVRASPCYARRMTMGCTSIADARLPPLPSPPRPAPPALQPCLVFCEGPRMPREAKAACARARRMECVLRNANNSGMTLTPGRQRDDLQPAITITMHRRVLRVRQVAPSDPHTLNRNENHRIYIYIYIYIRTCRHERRILARQGRFPRQVIRDDAIFGPL